MSVEDEERVRRETMALAVKGTLDHFSASSASSGGDMRIAVTREKPDEDSDPTQYLRFSVDKSPNNGDAIGRWMRIHRIAKQSPGWNEIHHSREEAILASGAWNEATGYARNHQVGLIWIDDPENLFRPDLED